MVGDGPRHRGIGMGARKGRPGRPHPRLPAEEFETEDAVSISRRVQDENRPVGD